MGLGFGWLLFVEIEGVMNKGFAINFGASISLFDQQQQ